MKRAKFILLFLIALCGCKAENRIETVAKQVSEEIMEQYEPLEGVMTLVADAKTGDILACVDLGGTGNNRPETYIYKPGYLFDIFRESAIMFLPESVRNSDKAFRFMMNQFGFTEYPMVTAKQVVKAATVFANHGILGDNEVEVVSPKVADAMLLMMEKAAQPDGNARQHGVKDCRIAIVSGDNKFVASALAIFPVEEPKYIVYNVVLHPSKGGITTGTGICVPAVGKIINEIISK